MRRSILLHGGQLGWRCHPTQVSISVMSGGEGERPFPAAGVVSHKSQFGDHLPTLHGGFKSRSFTPSRRAKSVAPTCRKVKTITQQGTNQPLSELLRQINSLLWG